MADHIDWFSVSDRVPEMGPAPELDYRIISSRRVLVSAGTLTTVGHMHQVESDTPRWACDSRFLLHGVTHWAELPRGPHG